MVKYKIINGFVFVSILYPFNKPDAIKVTSDYPVEKYIEYINQNNIEKAEIILEDISFLKKCPTLKYLKISPSSTAKNFDFSPLYELNTIKSLHCINVYGDKEQYISDIDFSKISGIENISLSINKGMLNYENLKSVKSLSIGNFKGRDRDLTDLIGENKLDTVQLIGCGIRSLKGIDRAKHLKCLYLCNNKSIENISDLYHVRETLTALRIDKCPKIKDFSILKEMKNLELLELWGSNKVPDLEFLREMKRIKTFIFNVDVLNGDLSPCLNLSYVYSDRNRKYYNYKNEELPKNEYVRGNESIELWRRLE